MRIRRERRVQLTVLRSEQLYSVITNPCGTITGIKISVLRDKMCTAFQDHCPCCCTNHGGVYSRPCPTLNQLRPGQQGFIHIVHNIDERNPKTALETCDRCKRREQKRSWLKDKWANLSQPFWTKTSEHTPCSICRNYQVEEEQPLRIVPLF